MPVIQLEGNDIPYAVRHSNRAKRIIVKYSFDKGLEVVYPQGTRKPAPPEVLRRNAGWIISTIEAAAAKKAKYPPRQYADGETFLVFGEPYVLRRQTGSALAKPRAELAGDLMLVSLPAGLVDSDNESVRFAVLDLYRRLARVHFTARVAEIAANHDFNYGTLRIKNQKQRWGSCSAKGNINLNMRLMMAPRRAIDYVIIHELCHLRILNHSAEYWALVESICPDFRIWRDWFKENSPCLVL